MKKIIFALVAMLCVTTASAQRARTSNYSNVDKKNHFAMGLGVGKLAKGFDASFDFDLRWQRDINEHFALDMLTVNVTAPFNSPKDITEGSFRFGGRGFTSPFYNNMRGYANLDLGYTLIGSSIKGFDGGANHAFGLEFGAGVEVTKKIALGYSLHYNTCTESTGHFGKISVRF